VPNRAKITKSFVLLLSMYLVMSATSCGGITLSVSDTLPPTFTFHRGFRSHVDAFPFFIVEELAPENEKVPYHQESRELNRVLWKIVPNPEIHGTSVLDNLGPITYGKLPKDFSQEVPQAGLAPALIEGKMYEAGAAATLMPNAVIRFRVENGEIVRISSGD
jgi:hypothetical protein